MRVDNWVRPRPVMVGLVEFDLAAELGRGQQAYRR